MTTCGPARPCDAARDRADCGTHRALGSNLRALLDAQAATAASLPPQLRATDVAAINRLRDRAS